MQRTFLFTLLFLFTMAPGVKAKTRILYAESFPGADLGAKINAADASLGAGPGEIWVENGGNIATGVVLSGGHVLRIFPGLYTSTAKVTPFRPKSNSKIIGSGWNTVLRESTAPGIFEVIRSYDNSTNNYHGDANIEVRDLKIEGARSDFNSTPSTISLGNCFNCTVDHVWLDRTHTIGITAGGGSSEGNYADNVRITNNLLTGVASQGIAAVNGKNILISGNTLRDLTQLGGPNAAPIDCEGNGATDILENVTISNNVIDNRGIYNSGNAIIFQGGGANRERVGPALIANNLIRGGEIYPTPTNTLSMGVYVIGARNVKVVGNNMERLGQSGIRLTDSTQCDVSNNKMQDVAGGGNAGMQIENSTWNTIHDNVQSWNFAGPVDTRIVELAGSDYNTYWSNQMQGHFGADSAGTLIVGAHSRVLSEIKKDPNTGDQIQVLNHTFLQTVNLKPAILTGGEYFYMPENYSVILVDASKGPTRLFLPFSITQTGRSYMIMKIDNTPNFVRVIAPTSGDSINGKYEYDLGLPYAGCTVVSANRMWLVF